jgi:hypothetical protein
MTKIAPAFIAAKKAFGPLLKDKNNPAFRSKYADLGACIDSVEDALLANDIAVYHETSEDATGITVECVLLHASGESIRGGKLHVPAAKQDPQGYGSALTYARRYSLMSICGIAPEDDDGNAASKGTKSQGNVAQASGPISATRIAFEQLPADWQAWLKDFAPQVDNLCEQSGAEAAQGLITENKLENEQIAGLFHLLSSKTRSALNALTKSPAQPRKAA